MRIQAWRKGPCKLPRRTSACSWRENPGREALPSASAASRRPRRERTSWTRNLFPLVIDLSVSEYLMAILRRLVEILAAKTNALSGTRRQKNQSLADFTASDIANFWLLYTANSYFPMLRHLFESKKGHPESLYTAMLSLAGSLTTFSTTVQARDLPLYDHDNLGACFTDLDEKLRQLLETVVPSNVVSLPLKLTQPSIYAAALANDKYLFNTRMYLAISADLGEADLLKRVPQLVKLCSATHIETLIRQALPGMPMVHVPSPPGAIPIKLNYQYFSLESVRRGVGGRAAGPQYRRLCSRRYPQPPIGIDYPSPPGGMILLLVLMKREEQDQHHGDQE